MYDIETKPWGKGLKYDYALQGRPLKAEGFSHDVHVRLFNPFTTRKGRMTTVTAYCLLT